MLNNNLVRACVLAFTLSLIGIMAGCSTPTQPVAKADGPNLSSDRLNDKITALLDSARQASSPQREQYLLQATDILADQRQADWAFNILQSIKPDSLGDSDYLHYIQRLSETGIASSHYFVARDALNQTRLKELRPNLPAAQQQQFLDARAQVDSLLGDFQQSLQTRVLLGQLLQQKPDAQMENNESIWQNLANLSAEQLKALQTHADSRTLRGWAELALLSRNNAANLQAQLQQVAQWQKRWPNHPASIQLPSDLQLLRQLIAEQPKKIALLLPQSGRLAGAAEAVRDGFMAAYYHAHKNHSSTPSIRQYNTADKNITQVYQQAIAEGAELIVGPLAKKNVSTLAQLPALQVPVLALNYRDKELSNSVNKDEHNDFSRKALPMALNLAPTQSPIAEPRPASQDHSLFAPELYQFGLAAEDEARQVARHAHLEGHHRAMIIAPERHWAKRSVEAFSREWQELGGQVVANTTYLGAGDYSKVIKHALLIDKSEQRHNKMRKLIYTNTKFEPRRRKDVDMIFLIANPPQARQIKPTLAFYYAGNIPVYATSQIYNGESDRKANRDLNGIRFNTLPWLFDTQSAQRKTIAANTSVPDAYKRLQALGVDAYHLYPRLPQLQKIPQARLAGATGMLSINADGRVERQQIWAKFSAGEAHPITDASIKKASSQP